jgi:hypothetical protein
MDSNELKRALRNVPHFKGVFAKDIFYFDGEIPSCYIINTGLSSTIGEHWIGLYILNNVILYFDSLGLSPFNDFYINKLLKSINITNLMYNNIRLQGLMSNVCGQYCIMFISRISNGDSFKKFLLRFSPCNYTNNDKKVSIYAKTKFNVKVKCIY